MNKIIEQLEKNIARIKDAMQHEKNDAILMIDEQEIEIYEAAINMLQEEI